MGVIARTSPAPSHLTKVVSQDNYFKQGINSGLDNFFQDSPTAPNLKLTLVLNSLTRVTYSDLLLAFVLGDIFRESILLR
jgi:hypothetical protein